MMTRFLGWGAALCALVAALIVFHALTRPAQVDAPAMALRSGATFVSLGEARGSYLVVTSLQTGGASQQAGLSVGDRIEDVDGLPAPTLDALDDDLALRPKGDVDLLVRRGDARIDIHMKRLPGV